MKRIETLMPSLILKTISILILNSPWFRAFWTSLGRSADIFKRFFLRRSSTEHDGVCRWVGEASHDVRIPLYRKSEINNCFRVVSLGQVEKPQKSAVKEMENHYPEDEKRLERFPSRFCWHNDTLHSLADVFLWCSISLWTCIWRQNQIQFKTLASWETFLWIGNLMTAIKLFFIKATESSKTKSSLVFVQS